MVSPDPRDIVHLATQGRLEWPLERGSAECVYRRQGNLILITHTEVPHAYEGRGIAGQLVRAVLDWARSEGLRVRPLCSYVAAYMRRHADTHDLLAS